MAESCLKGDGKLLSEWCQKLYNDHMLIHSYPETEGKLAELMDKVTEDREVVIIAREGHEDVALIAADELRSLQEMSHLLRSPKNAERLLSALNRSLAGEGETVDFMGLEEKIKNSLK